MTIAATLVRTIRSRIRGPHSRRNLATSQQPLNPSANDRSTTARALAELRRGEAALAEGRVRGFSPSVHGLHFPNRFPPGPTVTIGRFDPSLFGFGDASQGLCGGMALTARDLWAAGLVAPVDLMEPPPNGSPRFRALVRRQVQSLDWLRVPLRYFDLQALRPDPPSPLAQLLRREPARVPSTEREWPRIRAEIDRGVPALVGLIRASGASPWKLVQNHQVLGWAWVADDTGFTISVYDPNHPGRDDVELRVHVRPGAAPLRERVTLEQSTGEPLLGFFLQPYPPPQSMSAWR